MADGSLVSQPITAIIGPRRAGKTWLCFQAIRELIARKIPRERILFLSLEDERLHPSSGDELTELLDVHRELFGMPAGHEVYCFVDEIQNAPKWSKWVRRVTDQNPHLRLVVTGSSAKLLSTEIATELRGRARTITLFPYSWKEFLSSRGGAPGNLENLRYSPEKADVRRLYHDFETLLGYLGYAREIFLLFETHLLSPKVRNQLLYPRKIYGIDQGLLNAIRFSTSEDRGRILENMVYLELRRRGHLPYYFSGKGECDFILSEGVRAKTAIQACYRLGTDKTRGREIGSLLEAMRTMGCEEGLILTDDEHEDVVSGKERIAVRPFWLWALAA